MKDFFVGTVGALGGTTQALAATTGLLALAGATGYTLSKLKDTSLYKNYQ